jgi:hypothetical protein
VEERADGDVAEGVDYGDHREIGWKLGTLEVFLPTSQNRDMARTAQQENPGDVNVVLAL